jgi:hypothetical protein
MTRLYEFAHYVRKNACAIGQEPEYLGNWPSN